MPHASAKYTSCPAPKSSMLSTIDAIGQLTAPQNTHTSPSASIVLSIELFGAGQLVYFALACGIAYMLSGYFGLYSSQKILYSKLRTEFINIHAK